MFYFIQNSAIIHIYKHKNESRMSHYKKLEQDRRRRRAARGPRHAAARGLAARLCMDPQLRGRASPLTIHLSRLPSQLYNLRA